MKLNRLIIDEFADGELQTIQNDNISGQNLVIQGGNRSGKTLSFNALLYGLFGPRATFGVPPGRRSTVRFHFDNNDVLERGGGGRKYSTRNDTFLKDEADEKIHQRIGPQEVIQQQFIHSETAELPLSNTTGDGLITIIRTVVQSDVQEEIDRLEDNKEDLERHIEETRRLELWPRKDELGEIDIERFQNRLDKIQKLQTIIESGQIQNIKNRLQDDQEVRTKVENLNDRLRTVRRELRKKERLLREENRFTEEVDDIIIDAIQELTCPVCGGVIRKQLAQTRLSGDRCPHCGRERSLDEVREHLKDRVDEADAKIDSLESEVEELRNEKEQIEDNIHNLEKSSPALSGINDLTIHTLKKNNYDISAVHSETQKRLKKQKETIEELKQRRAELEKEISEIESKLDGLRENLQDTVHEVEELRLTSFEEDIEAFQEAWSDNYQELAPDLAAQIRINQDGSIAIPGTFRSRDYQQLSTGEVRLINIAFALTIAEKSASNSNNGHQFECIILDEPFTNIDGEIRDRAIEYMQNSDFQFILTTSEEAVANRFESNQIEPLDRINIQTTFEDLEDLATDD